jgi:trk system potassium uptake protein TrkA
MNIIICGAGTVGSHAAEVLANAGHNITMVDTRADRLSEIEETMDVRTLQGNITYGEVLKRAGIEKADLLVAATNSDEINLLGAAIAKHMGAGKTIARVRHSAYFDERGVDYDAVLQIDHLICPEYLTALAIASSLRNPAALAIENFARGRIEMQELAVAENAPATGESLSDLHMPAGTRLAAMNRDGKAMVPEARTVIQPHDRVVVVGNRDVFSDARRLFTRADAGSRRVVIMGGSPMGVWLCRALKDRDFQIRLFEIDRGRAEELAEKLDWVTVINADPTDPAVFEEERIEEADAFVSLLTDDDEYNILAGAWAKSLGARMAVAAVQRPNYLDLMQRIGIDKPFSPRAVAVRELENLLADRRLYRLASLAEGVVDVYQAAVGRKAPIAGKPLREIKLSPEWMIAAIQQPEGEVTVPGADDRIAPGQTILIIGRHGEEKKLRKLLGIN